MSRSVNWELRSQIVYSPLALGVYVGVVRRRDQSANESDQIQLSLPLRDWVDRALRAPGIRFVPLDAAAAAERTLLPGSPQGDPADRFLMAIARTQDMTLATRDEPIVEYGRCGYVRVVKL